jgi:hypothetical protein
MLTATAFAWSHWLVWREFSVGASPTAALCLPPCLAAQVLVIDPPPRLGFPLSDTFSSCAMELHEDGSVPAGQWCVNIVLHKQCISQAMSASLQLEFGACSTATM